MKRMLVSLIVFLFFFTLTTSVAHAAISASGQYIKTKNVVRMFFGNLKGVSKVSYVLTYEGKGVPQGVFGSFSPGKNKSVSRDSYLGTCSAKVCTPHRNVKNMKVEVTTKYTNGKSSTTVVKVK